MPQGDKWLEWTSCECGCHDWEFRVAGPVYYRMSNFDIGSNKGKDKTPYHLYDGHHPHGKKLGEFASFEAADQAARKLAKAALPEYRKELERKNQELKRAEASL